MIKIALGTTSEYKVNAVKHILYKFDVVHEIVTQDVSSDVSEQPNNPGEIKQGAINRAKKAMKLIPDEDIGMGIEFGYEPGEEGYKMVCYAAIVDKEGNIYTEHSASLKLPKLLHECLEKNIEISDNVDMVIDQIEKRTHKSAMIQYLYKRKFIYECVESLVLSYILKGIVY